MFCQKTKYHRTTDMLLVSQIFEFVNSADVLWLSQVFENFNIADTWEIHQVLKQIENLWYIAGICND